MSLCRKKYEKLIWENFHRQLKLQAIIIKKAMLWVKKHDKYIYVAQKFHLQSDVFYVREMEITSVLWEKKTSNIVTLS